MRAIVVGNPGPDYRLEIEEMPRPEPGPGEVLIRVASAGINRADRLQAQGRYPPPKGVSPLLGLEVAGEVAARGDGVDEFAVDDRVCALVAGGGYAEYCVAHAGSVLPIPAGVQTVHAAALPEVHFTVWTNLMDSARLAPGESALIHGGSSGIGTAAIQLCAVLGHQVFTTAGSDAKRTACFELGASRAIDYHTEDFVAVIEQLTDGRGVDVILDMVGGDYIGRNLRALAKGGRVVNIAFQKGTSAEVNFAPMLAKRLSFMATTLRARSHEEKRAIRDALLANVWPLIAQGRIRPIVDSVYPLADAGQAHERMASSQHIGKILLVP